ncbi:MAG: 50S ribosomal protein L11 methyltransferase [Prevotella sp.]|nr:50S ribosomal protein L11 methyltransferase [Prevotella sp.]MBQ4041664.1 50S ribosomal protein L11 methyltransferase [Prevotella sp.]
MKYLSTTFKIECPSSDLLQPCRELLADSCGEVGYESFMDSDDGIIGYIQQENYSEPHVRELIASFPIAGVTITYNTEEIPDQDWNETWEAEGFEPIVVDGKVTIYDAHHVEDAEQFSSPIQIGIQARNAFGTGNHETTRMIVSTLLELPLTGRRVLDCGCGTGILGITAVKCGAASVVAYDIDEFSSDNARHNAVLNGVGEQIDVLLGNANVLSHVEGIFDVVLANINRNVLLQDMEAFHNVMASGASLVLSGFYTEDAPMLLQKAETLGLHEISRKVDNNWCCLLLA